MKVIAPIIIMALFIAAAFIIPRLLKEPEPPRLPAQDALRLSSSPTLSDNGNHRDLERALKQSLKYYNLKESDEQFRFGPRTTTAAEIRTALTDLINALNQHGLSDGFYSYITNNFQFLKSSADQVLFTGYFEASLKGARTASQQYRYPIFRRPQDLYRIPLHKLLPEEAHQYVPREIRVRIDGKRNISKYFTRDQIDYEAALTGRGDEILWVDDLIDLFFLHIQGSGTVELPDGSLTRVGYAEKNGQPYRAIGKKLIEDGYLTKDNVSMQSIKSWLRENPEKIREVFEYNPSYIFFRELEDGPVGNINVPLTAERSIATDSSLFPKGAPAFIKTERPVFDSEGNLTGWEPYVRFVVNQDTGGAIKGPGRVDVFTGNGEEAELFAGHMKRSGELYFLVKRDAPQSHRGVD